MRENSIALIPELGYQFKQTNSTQAILWLKWVALTENIAHIQHCKNSNEKKINQYKLDGWDEEKNMGYEFHGCYFHGCPKCFNPDFFNTSLQLPMGIIYKNHCKRIDFLKKKISLTEIWACEFAQESKSNPILAQFIKHNKIFDQINPREAVTGGRVNAAKIYYKCKKNEKNGRNGIYVNLLW